MSDALTQLFKDLYESKKKEVKLLFVLLVISMVMNLIEVTAFMYFQSRWDYETTTTTTTTQQVDGEENSIVNGDQYNDDAENRSQ